MQIKCVKCGKIQEIPIMEGHYTQTHFINNCLCFNCGLEIKNKQNKLNIPKLLQDDLK